MASVTRCDKVEEFVKPLFTRRTPEHGPEGACCQGRLAVTRSSAYRPIKRQRLPVGLHHFSRATAIDTKRPRNCTFKLPTLFDCKKMVGSISISAGLKGKSAGQTFEKAAASQKNCESKDMAADTLVEAYKSYKTTDPRDAARVLEEAINLFTLRGQFRRAASYKADLGALYETELEDLPAAIQAYENSGDWYLQDQAESLASKSFLKVAELSATAEKYSTAVEYFEKVIKISMNNQLTKWSLKDHFFKASLCRLAEGDTVACERGLEQYVDNDAGFVQTREYQLLLNICAAVKDGNSEDFSSKVYEFDQFSKLDRWKTSLLLRIKNQMAAAEDDLL